MSLALETRVRSVAFRHRRGARHDVAAAPSEAEQRMENEQLRLIRRAGVVLALGTLALAVWLLLWYAIEFVLHRTFTARVVCHHHLHWERRIGVPATSSRPSAFRIFCLALEKMVSTATTVRFWCRAIS